MPKTTPDAVRQVPQPGESGFAAALRPCVESFFAKEASIRAIAAHPDALRALLLGDVAALRAAIGSVPGLSYSSADDAFVPAVQAGLEAAKIDAALPAFVTDGLVGLLYRKVVESRPGDVRRFLKDKRDALFARVEAEFGRGAAESVEHYLASSSENLAKLEDGLKSRHERAKLVRLATRAEPVAIWPDFAGVLDVKKATDDPAAAYSLEMIRVDPSRVSASDIRPLLDFVLPGKEAALLGLLFPMASLGDCLELKIPVKYRGVTLAGAELVRAFAADHYADLLAEVGADPSSDPVRKALDRLCAPEGIAESLLRQVYVPTSDLDLAHAPGTAKTLLLGRVTEAFSKDLAQEIRDAFRRKGAAPESAPILDVRGISEAVKGAGRTDVADELEKKLKDGVVLRIDSKDGNERTMTSWLRVDALRDESSGALGLLAYTDLTELEPRTRAETGAYVDSPENSSGLMTYATLVDLLARAAVSVRVFDPADKAQRAALREFQARPRERKDSDGAAMPVEVMTSVQLCKAIDESDPDGKAFGFGPGTEFQAKKGNRWTVKSFDEKGEVVLDSGETADASDFFRVFQERGCKRVPPCSDAESLLSSLRDHSGPGRGEPWKSYLAQSGKGVIVQRGSEDDHDPTPLRYLTGSEKGGANAIEILRWGSGGVEVREGIGEKSEDKVSHPNHSEEGSIKLPSFKWKDEGATKVRILPYHELYAWIGDRGASPIQLPRQGEAAHPHDHMHGGFKHWFKSATQGGWSIASLIGGAKIAYEVYTHEMHELSHMGELAAAARVGSFMHKIGMVDEEYNHGLKGKLISEKKKLEEELYNRIVDRPGSEKWTMVEAIVLNKHAKDWEIRAAYRATLESEMGLYPDMLAKHQFDKHGLPTYFWYRRLGLGQPGDNAVREYEARMAKDGKYFNEGELVYEQWRAQKKDGVEGKWWVPLRAAISDPEQIKKVKQRGKTEADFINSPERVNDNVFKKFSDGGLVQSLGMMERHFDLGSDVAQMSEVPFVMVFSGAHASLPYSLWKEELSKRHYNGNGLIVPPFLFLDPKSGHPELFQDLVLRYAQEVDMSPDEIKDLQDFKNCYRSQDPSGGYKKLRAIWKKYGTKLVDKLSGKDLSVMARAQKDPAAKDVKTQVTVLNEAYHQQVIKDDYMKWRVYGWQNAALPTKIAQLEKLGNSHWAVQNRELVDIIFDDVIALLKEVRRPGSDAKNPGWNIDVKGHKILSDADCRDVQKTYYDAIYKQLREHLHRGPDSVNPAWFEKLRPFGIFADQTFDGWRYDAHRRTDKVIEDPRLEFGIFLSGKPPVTRDARAAGTDLERTQVHGRVDEIMAAYEEAEKLRHRKEEAARVGAGAGFSEAA